MFVFSSVGCALTSSLVLINILLVVQGIAFAFKSALVISMARLVVPQNRVGSAIGWLSIAFTIATALGPTIGSYFGQYFGYETSFLVSGAILFVGLVFSITVNIPETNHHTNKIEEPKVTKKAFNFKDALSSMFYLPAIPCSLVDCMAATAQGTTVALLLLIASEEGIAGATFYFIIYSLVTALSRPISGNLNDRFGSVIIIPLFIIAIIGMVVLSSSTSIVGVIIASVLMAVGQAPVHSVMQAESVRTANEDEIARAANTSYVFPDIGMWLGPVAGGAIMGALGGRAVLFVNVLYLILGLIISSIWYYKTRKNRQQVEDNTHE